jgi:hypothetical protein
VSIKRADSKYLSNRWAKTSIMQRFWMKTEPEGGCLIWKACLDRKGYGVFVPMPRKRVMAHRWLFERIFGQLEKQRVVMHSCDNPACVKLQHLDQGTIDLNNKDSVAKGRNARGERVHQSKLTEDQVREIRSLCAQGISKTEIARRFSVGRRCVRMISTGRTWRHVK